MTPNNVNLWTALITPMLENGAVDYESLDQLIQEQDKAGNGILVLGSTAEALNLDLEERKKILHHICAANLSVPLMVGVGGINLNETQEWIAHLEGQPVEAYLLVTPLYAKPGEEGQYQWFKTLLDQATRACMLYNVPSRAGVALNFNTVKRLNGHPRFWAIKEASGSTEDFAMYKQAAPDARMYSGDDALMPDFTELGAVGLVSVASNVWPKETHLYTEMCLNNVLDEVELWQAATNSLFVASNPVPVKSLMTELGQIKTPVLRAPLSHKDMVKTQEVMACHEQVQNWFQKHNQ